MARKAAQASGDVGRDLYDKAVRSMLLVVERHILSLHSNCT